MRVLFLIKYPRRGPSSRYRVLQFIPYLESNGISCEVQSLHADGYLDSRFRGEGKGAAYYVRRLLARIGKLMRGPRYDVVFIQKELFPYLVPVTEFFLKTAGAPIIYDLDDAIFLFYTGSGNRVVRSLLGGKVPAVIRMSSAVLCGNAYLKEYAGRYNQASLLFPTVIDPSRYIVKGAGEPRASGARPSGVPGIVWIGSPETFRYVSGMAGALSRISKQEAFTLKLIGVTDRGPFDAFETLTVPWSEESEAEELGSADIGIMPLPDSEWSRGKCGLKLLQYMAAGLPVVTSPLGGGEDIVEDGTTGLIARNEGEWTAHLLALIRDADARRELGLAGRRRVEEQFSLGLWAPRLAEVIRRVADGSGLKGIGW